MSTTLLVRLELALHDVDCDVPHDENFKGHGDKYSKLALAAAKLVVPDEEPWWLRDRQIVAESNQSQLIALYGSIADRTDVDQALMSMMQTQDLHTQSLTGLAAAIGELVREVRHISNRVGA